MGDGQSLKLIAAETHHPGEKERVDRLDPARKVPAPKNRVMVGNASSPLRATHLIYQERPLCKPAGSAELVFAWV